MALETFHLKGLARFFSSDFFIKQLLLVPIEVSLGRFKFYWYFTEFVEFKIDYPVSGIPYTRLFALN